VLQRPRDRSERSQPKRSHQRCQSSCGGRDISLPCGLCIREYFRRAGCSHSLPGMFIQLISTWMAGEWKFSIDNARLSSFWRPGRPFILHLSPFPLPSCRSILHPSESQSTRYVPQSSFHQVVPSLRPPAGFALGPIFMQHTQYSNQTPPSPYQERVWICVKHNHFLSGRMRSIHRH